MVKVINNKVNSKHTSSSKIEVQESEGYSVKHQESGFSEKSPDLYCVRGSLTFSLRYDFIHRVLMVHVIRANGIPAEVRFSCNYCTNF